MILLTCTLVQEVFKYHDFPNSINDLCFQTVLSFHLLAFVFLNTNYLVIFFMLL